MKKLLIFTILILALLFSLLPASSALAERAVIETKLTIHNRTHGDISIVLTNAKGFHYFYSYADSGTNEYFTYVLPGIYTYYIITKCANETGRWNMYRSHMVDLYCPREGLDVLFRTPEMMPH